MSAVTLTDFAEAQGIRLAERRHILRIEPMPESLGPLGQIKLLWLSRALCFAEVWDDLQLARIMQMLGFDLARFVDDLTYAIEHNDPLPVCIIGLSDFRYLSITDWRKTAPKFLDIDKLEFVDSLPTEAETHVAWDLIAIYKHGVQRYTQYMAKKDVAHVRHQQDRRDAAPGDLGQPTG